MQAIQFGKSVDMGLEAQQAFPFDYTFVPTDQDTWEVNKGTDNLIDIGPTIPALSTRQWQVRLDNDNNFKLLWIKYTAYGMLLAGGYVWYEPLPAGAFFLDPADYQNAIGTPLLRYIRVAVWSQTTGQTIYGGQALTQNQAGVYAGKVPIPLTSIQGYDYGPGQLRTPIFLPMGGMLMFEITNTNLRQAITVGAVIHGLKVRI